MGLATVMDLVLEDMQQQPVSAFALDASLAVHADNLIGAALIK